MPITDTGHRASSHGHTGRWGAIVSREKQVDANRLNAQRSTVPKTENGKRTSDTTRSSADCSLRQHYSAAKTENSFAVLPKSFTRSSSLQLFVDRIVSSAWRLRRVVQVEAGLHVSLRDYVKKNQAGTDSDSLGSENEEALLVLGCVFAQSRREATRLQGWPDMNRTSSEGSSARSRSCATSSRRGFGTALKLSFGRSSHPADLRWRVP